MLALALTLSLCTAPSARLVSDETTLSPADVAALDREMRVLEGNIQLLNPQFPKGLVFGAATGFSFAVLLLPGIPILIFGVASTSFASTTLLTMGVVLTGLGGVSLLAALLCLVIGNNIENDMAAERADLVRRRDALKRKLEPYRPPPAQPVVPVPQPGFVPGVQLDVPSPWLVTVARY